MSTEHSQRPPRVAPARTPLVVAPLSHVSEAEPLCRAGADELYCGVMTGSWRRSFTPMQSPNRRDIVRASLGSAEELAEVVQVAHAHGVRVACTANVFYERSQVDQAFGDLAAGLEAAAAVKAAAPGTPVLAGGVVGVAPGRTAAAPRDARGPGAAG